MLLFSRQFSIYLIYGVYVFVEVCSFKINLLPWLLQDAWLVKVHILEAEGNFSGPNKSCIARTLCNAKGMCLSTLQYNKIIHGWQKNHLAVIL
jgi:hypothetical protein